MSASDDRADSRLTLDFRLLLYLFVGLRLVVLIAHQPQWVTLPNTSAAPLERGVTVYGDFAYHFGIAESVARGLLPYRDFWYEYPPVIPLISSAVYALSGPNFSAYANVLAIVLLIFDVGTLLLIRRIGARLYNTATGETLALIYALLAAPLILMFWNFEGVVAFLVLLTLWLLIERRDIPAAVGIAIGGLTKIVPLVLIAAIWRVRPIADAAKVTLIALTLVALGVGLILLNAPRFGLPSLTAQLNKPSSETVWALLDRNYRTGAFDNNRLDPTAAVDSRANPPLIPAWLRTAFFLALGAALFLHVRRTDAFATVALGALAIVLLYLWSAGWSIQWQLVLIPLMLLTLADRSAVLLCLGLAIFSFIEYPLLFARGVDSTGATGALLPQFVPLFALTVMARTAILAAFGVLLYRRLGKP